MIVPILWALVSTAEATSRIVVTSDVPVLVSVNGHPYTPKSTSYAILCDAGRNKVQAGNSLVIIDVPDGHEARMVVKTGKLTLTETVFVEGLKELDYVDYYYDPNEDPASRPTDVVRVEDRPVTQDVPVAGPGTVRFVRRTAAFTTSRATPRCSLSCACFKTPAKTCSSSRARSTSRSGTAASRPFTPKGSSTWPRAPR